LLNKNPPCGGRKNKKGQTEGKKKNHSRLRHQIKGEKKGQGRKKGSYASAPPRRDPKKEKTLERGAHPFFRSQGRGGREKKKGCKRQMVCNVKGGPKLPKKKRKVKIIGALRREKKCGAAPEP